MERACDSELCLNNRPPGLHRTENRGLGHYLSIIPMLKQEGRSVAFSQNPEAKQLGSSCLCLEDADGGGGDFFPHLSASGDSGFPWHGHVTPNSSLTLPLSPLPSQSSLLSSFFLTPGPSR